MRTCEIVDDALSLSMGTTGALLGLQETVRIDYKIDELDDIRRENYINTLEDHIERLTKFIEEFKDHGVFSNWAKKHISFLKKDLEKQIYYEKLSDNLRTKLYNNIENNIERLRNENSHFEGLFFEKSYTKITKK